ncbi:hypothetical protein PAXRUDRAFT_19312 [Paxillus rubicundulus Ve08.2h10]|uniref:Uncharacterized protein n=1 Tax=Paxillus rubicundulus Ve08.2h10 TaxID=930991 RepID=A0A0D0CIQ0_9AGAM|nr:hypothetical protein PAXRUDRAFT_19312 [Paxillus rubicundulus Ve08.2h10]
MSSMENCLLLAISCSLAEHHRGARSPPPHRRPDDGPNQQGDSGVAAVACAPGPPEASSARAPSIEVINEARPLSMAITAMAPPTIKVEQVVGNIKMGNSNSNNNNVVSKVIAKGKGKERAAIEEVGEDAGQEVMVKTVAKEAKGKGKVKEVGEKRAVKQGKGKGKGKEVVQEEGVVEQTMVMEKSKNKGKWRESSKGTKMTRGRSQSTATSKFKSAELVPLDSEDEYTGLMPRGPSLTLSSVQPWLTCNFCITKVTSAAKVQAWPASTATAGRSSAPRPLHIELEDPRPPRPPSVNALIHTCRRQRWLQHPNLKLPAPQKSMVERHGSRGWSIQAMQRNPKPEASTAAPPASSDKVIANLQAEVWMLC